MRALVATILIAGCTPGWKQTPHDQLFQYEPPVALVAKPSSYDPTEWWTKTETLFVRPLGKLLSPGTYVKTVVGGPPARDVNRLGQVPDSSWFVNRIGRRAYSVAEALQGAAQDGGLAPGTLDVISGKIDGVSAGFVLRDSAGTVWFLKLDHPAFPELSTSAEVITSRLLWLAGYRVPSMRVIDIDRSRFVLSPTARTKDRYNRSIPLTARALANLLANTNPDKDGRIRVLISRQAPGENLGPFSYQGRRLDDPNDLIPHEHRRSLRALWLFSAWVNNTDTRDANSLNVFRPVAGKLGVVDHYLLDFGDAFGSTGLGEKAAVEGWTYLLDWRAIGRNLVSLGFRYPRYRHVQRSPVRSIGLFESKIFIPARWHPELPNPAFDQRTSADLFWAASILARIQPDHVRAAVAAGNYREDGAVAYVVDTLLARRKKLLEYALAGYLPLDRPRTDGFVLRLDNLRALGGLAVTGPFHYVVRWNRTRGADRELARGTAVATDAEVVIDLSTIRAHRDAVADDPFITVELSQRGGDVLAVHLRWSGDRLVPVAVDR
ncbi:MAG: hypothetical protein H0V17_28490 [Deltaproteobacteria bacterium]|nr:hypothetical protein [Deltaproteobacteria bacterium]